MEVLGFGAGFVVGMVFHHLMKESSKKALSKEVSEYCERLERLQQLNIDSEIQSLQNQWEHMGCLGDKKIRLLDELKMRKYLKNAGTL